MIITVKVEYNEIDDFIIFCMFNDIKYTAIVYRRGILGDWYLVYLEGSDSVHKKLDKKFKILTIIKN